MQDIGSWIRDSRKRIGWNQTELAQKVGVNQVYVSLWETGKRHPTPSELAHLQQLFGAGPHAAHADAAPSPAVELPSMTRPKSTQNSLPLFQAKEGASAHSAPSPVAEGMTVDSISQAEFEALAEPRRRGRPKGSTNQHQHASGAGSVALNVPTVASPVLAANASFSDKVSFIWAVADILRGDYKQSEYGKVILPFTVLRRMDQVLSDSRQEVQEALAGYQDSPSELRHQMLLRASGHRFYNTSKLDFVGLLGDPNHMASNLAAYVNGFSPSARDILEHFLFDSQIERLDKANLLFLVVQKFAAFDLHPDRVSNHEMGTIFEELIRKFAEASNETAGEHFTPREVIRLMVNLLFAQDDAALRKPGIVRTIYDPACGTGGMLSVAEEALGKMNTGAKLEVFGQELNDESYAICKADMLIKGQHADNIKKGNSFSVDGLPELRSDYLISNPPFGVDWTKAESVVRSEHEKRGYAGRFGPGLPRKNDGSLLFLLHMWSKRKPVDQGGSRLAIVFNGSPLFTGAAGSGESEIRRWIIENDWLEAIIALPDQMFYNTGISTYIWLLTNRKADHRKGKVQLINGVSRFQKMRKSLGDKRKELSDEDIVHLTRLYHHFEAGEQCKIFKNSDFGYQRITVERPLRLAFQASPERIASLDPRTGPELAQVLSLLDPAKRYLDREEFLSDLSRAARRCGVRLTAAQTKAVIAAVSQRDESAHICKDSHGRPEPDPDLRDNENVPLEEDIDAYMAREVLPHVPDAWVDREATKIGYEIPFTRHFYVYQPPRPLEVIEKEIRDLEEEIRGMLEEVLG